MTIGQIAKLLERRHFQPILIGPGAAALQGAPVQVVTLEFLFRKTRANMNKLKLLARDLDALLWREIYPGRGSYRIMRDVDGFQVIFRADAAGSKTFAEISRRARAVGRNEWGLLVADMPDVVLKDSDFGGGKSAMKRPRVTRKAKLEALKKESDLALRDQIRRLLALPPERRTNFLRKRVGICMSCL